MHLELVLPFAGDYCCERRAFSTRLLPAELGERSPPTFTVAIGVGKTLLARRAIDGCSLWF